MHGVIVLVVWLSDRLALHNAGYTVEYKQTHSGLSKNIAASEFKPHYTHEKLPTQTLHLDADIGCCSDLELSGIWSLNPLSCTVSWQSAGWLIFTCRLGQNSPGSAYSQ